MSSITQDNTHTTIDITDPVLTEMIHGYMKRNGFTIQQALETVFKQREKTKERNKKNANAYYTRNKEEINKKRKARRDADKEKPEASTDSDLQTNVAVDKQFVIDNVNVKEI
jgi:hypothetical protein